MRTKSFRREMTAQKIKRRQNMALSIANHDGFRNFINAKHYKKLDEAIHGSKPGLFAKHDYGAITSGTSSKTNARKRHASYRHKGGYGKSMLYTRHDQKQIDSLQEQLAAGLYE